MALGDGRFEDVYHIEYRLDHNHKLGEKGTIGTQQKSKAVRERIKAMLFRGMSITAIMNELTMDHAKFSRLMERGGNEQRIARDDLITYDDVYNILHAVMSRQMRKDKDPLISARLWMEEMQSQGDFT
ncbi:hypothetical protein BGZ99_003883, partial [Dissophora globulifera]